MVIGQKVTTDYDAYTKYFDTLDAAYNRIMGQLESDIRGRGIGGEKRGGFL